MDNKQIFSTNLLKELKKIGKTQTEMARDLGYPEMTVSNWINSKTYPRINRIQEMADYFNISKSDLVEDKSKTNNEKTLTDKEKILLKKYNSLNDVGQNEAVKRVSELTEIPRYLKNSNRIETIAAHADHVDEEQIKLINEDIEDMKKW